MAKHYGVGVVACPPRRGNRKGSVEKSIHFATQRFWRTMTATTIDDAQRQLDRFCERIGDRRPRSIAKLEELWAKKRPSRFSPHVDASVRVWETSPSSSGCGPSLPPATRPPSRTHGTVGPSALVPFEGNAYSVPPGLIGVEVAVRHRLGTAGIEIISAAGNPPGQPLQADPRWRLCGA